MPKKIFGLSQQTQDTLTDNVKKMADAWDCSTSFIYQILREEKPDVFPPFREFYTALLRAGLSTAEFDTDLAFLREQYLTKLPARDIAAAFSGKFKEQNRTIERYVDAVSDGEWTLDEVNELEDLLLAERDALDLALNGLKHKREKLEAKPNLRPVS